MDGGEQTQHAGRRIRCCKVAPTVARVAAVVFVLLSGVGTATASADVVVGPVQTVGGTTSLSGVACPSPTECLALGAPTPAAAGGSAVAPGALVPVDGGVAGSVSGISDAVQGIGCSPDGSCLAAGPAPGTGSAGALVTIAAAQQVGDPVLVPGGGGLSSVACPSDGRCVAVGGTSVVAVTAGSAGPLQTVAGGLLAGVACASPASCFAVGFDRTSTHGLVVPIAGGVAGSVDLPAGVSALFGVACADATDCYAVGTDPAGDGVVVPIVGGVIGSPVDVAGVSRLTGVACSGPGACVAVGGLDQNRSPDDESAFAVVPITGGLVGGVQTFETPASTSLSGLGCAANGECVAAGQTSPAAGTVVGAVVPILIAGSVGMPAALIGTPATGQTFALNDPTAPVVAFTCEPGFAGALASPRGCTGTIAGRAVTNGQALDTTHAGTFTLTVVANQADGQQSVGTSTFTVAKGADSIFFPQIGPFPYRQPAVTLGAIAASGQPIVYTVVSGACAVSAATLTFGGPGPCVVRADEPGTTNLMPASATSTITIEPPTPPVCSGLAVDVAAGQAATITLGCADAPSDGGDPLRFATETLPGHGRLTGFDSASGTVTYTPTGDFTGPDSFTFDATDDQGVSSPATISLTVATPPASIAAPVVAGTARVGHTLSCSPGTWSGTAPLAYAYRWLRGGAAVPGRTGAHYPVGTADAGHTLACAVTATNRVGGASAVSRRVTVVLPSNAFTLGRRVAGAGGTLSVRVVPSGPGRLRVVATYGVPGRATGGPRLIAATYGTRAVKATRAAALTVRVTPTSRARTALRVRGHMAVDIAVTFTPTGGRPRTKTAGVTA